MDRYKYYIDLLECFGYKYVNIDMMNNVDNTLILNILRIRGNTNGRF